MHAQADQGFPWHGIRGQAAVFEQFERSLQRDRLASTYLFVGPPGVGKRSTALAMARALLCESRKETELTACGVCGACTQVLAGTHPDLEVVCKPADRTWIPLELFIGDRENRMREGLCHNLSLKPFRGGRKIAIIDDADYLNPEGANCLLKTLEEPPPRSVLILIGTSPQRQLPTIRSRCQIIRFRPLEQTVLADLIQGQGLISDRDAALELARWADGSLQRAIEYSHPAVREFRSRLLSQLAKGDFWSPEFLKELDAFIESAGKEAPPRRKHLRLAIGFALQFYRELLRALSGAEVRGDEVRGDEALVSAVAKVQQVGFSDVEHVARCIDCCLELLADIDANAHITAVSDVWLDEVTQLAGS
ncbi:MAG: polymerase subunit tau [Planctomycetota bacterium]